MKAPVASTFAVIASNNEVFTSVLEYCITQLHYIVTGGYEKKVGCAKFFLNIFFIDFLSLCRQIIAQKKSLYQETDRR